MTLYRHQLFNEQLIAFEQNYTTWLNEARNFLQHN